MNEGQELKSEVVIVNVPPRRIIRVPKNETPAAKSYRLMAAVVKAFAQEHPKEALQIVQEVGGKIGKEENA